MMPCAIIAISSHVLNQSLWNWYCWKAMKQTFLTVVITSNLEKNWQRYRPISTVSANIQTLFWHTVIYFVTQSQYIYSKTVNKIKVCMSCMLENNAIWYHKNLACIEGPKLYFWFPNSSSEDQIWWKWHAIKSIHVFKVTGDYWALIPFHS